MTTGICRLCHAAGAIEPSADHLWRCPDHAACAERAETIADGEHTDPASLAPDDLVRLQRKLASAWIDRHMGLIGRVILEHYGH